MASWQRGTHRLAALFFMAALFCFTLPARGDEQVPLELRGVGIEDHTGKSIDLNLTFQDERGQTLPLRQYFHSGKPVALFLVYYGCPSLCTFVLNAGLDSFKELDWNTGTKYEVVAVSIDPRETPEMAVRKKESYVAEYLKSGKDPKSAQGWHFLVGKQSEITQLTSQIGFKYKWVEEEKQFAHASAFFMLTPEGKISRTFYGIMYPPRDVKLALLEASNGKIGSLVDQILLFCYHYDAKAGKYVLLANRIMTGTCVLTLVLLGFFVAGLLKRNQPNSGVRHHV